MTAALIPSEPTTEQLGAATKATYVVFAGSGFAFASWAARIPQVRTHLHLDPSRLGLVLFSIAVGSVIALPLSGPLVARIGPRRAVASMALLLSVGLAIVSIGYLVGVPLLVVGLFLLGMANGFWDVSMNVHAAAVEQLLGRSIMSRFHAGFSLGTVTGALVGTVMVAIGVPVSAHLLGVAVLEAIAVPLATRRFLPDVPQAGAPAPSTSSGPQDTAGATPPRRSSLAPWLEPRTLLVGVMVLAFAFAEGAGGDWISVSVIDHHHAIAAIGTLTFAMFLAAMTAGRWFGPPLLDRFGRVAVLRTTAVVAVVGLVLFVFGPDTPVAVVGAMLWGLGSSLGFPVGMSAGADEPAYAAGRVSVIASIGYCAFLGGPPLIGFLGNRYTVSHALLVVAVLLTVAGVVAGATRPPARRVG